MYELSLPLKLLFFLIFLIFSDFQKSGFSDFENGWFADDADKAELIAAVRERTNQLLQASSASSSSLVLYTI